MKKEELIKEMMSDTTYIDWLVHFTNGIKDFSDDQWLFPPESEQILDDDSQNVDKLHLFYEGINNYAQLNGINPMPVETGNFYRIKINQIGFEIGFIEGPATIFYCERVSLDNQKKFIDFNDIMTGKKQDNVNQINETLDSISNTIIKAYKSGISIDLIISAINDAIKEITPKTSDKDKVTDKTYLTNSGKDIRDSKMQGTFEVNISEHNQRIADKRIELAEKLDADIATRWTSYYAKTLKK